MRVIVRGVADKTNYTLSPNDPLQPTALNRDSKGLRVEGGFRFDITSLLYGEVRAGYFQRNYADPTLEDTSGLSFGADLLWNVTPLTTLKVGADRRVDEAASTTIAGNRTTQFDASVDHELLRNLILSGDFMYRRIAPLGPLRASDEFYARAGARILLNRQLSIRASYRYAKRNSNVAARAFSENRAMLAAVLTF
ncbi:MAG: outer membrane beta-barrel protein [Novosphingobium sp.]